MTDRDLSSCLFLGQTFVGHQTFRHGNEGFDIQCPRSMHKLNTMAPFGDSLRAMVEINRNPRTISTDFEICYI